MSNFLEIEEIAKRFRRSVSWVYQNYKRLHKEKNFPLPHRLNGYNILWLDKEVDFWFNLQVDVVYRLKDKNSKPCYDKLLAANAAVLAGACNG